MDMMEKVERLREKADVTREEAMAALDAAGGDLLDAMVLLERQGKVKKPEQSTFSTQYEEQKEYIRVRDKVEEQESSAPDFKRSVKRFFRVCVRFIKETTFVVTKKEDTLFKMPTFVFLLLLLFFWEALFPVMILALFFGIRYSFEGAQNAAKANDVLDRAGVFAEDVKREFQKDFGSEEKM